MRQLGGEGGARALHIWNYAAKVYNLSEVTSAQLLIDPGPGPTLKLRGNTMSVSERAEQADISLLILPDRIHGSLYYDQGLFEQELRQIWRKAWLYVGHESEVPKRGDYVCRRVGQQPLIMVRGSDDKVRVLYNRCRHRANLICHKDRDNAAEFVCPYHGWTYSIDGRWLRRALAELTALQ